MDRWHGAKVWLGLLTGAMVVSGCSGAVRQAPGSLKVVATTTIVADVVRQVAGDGVKVGVLLPVGADPHGFSPTPQDVARVAEADLVFANGAGLEEFLDQLLRNAGEQAEVVYVSEGIELLEADATHVDETDAANHNGEHAGGDPHTWTTPTNVMVWVDAIEVALVRHDPENAESYRANAAAYQGQLHDLDVWIQEQIAQIAESERLLVTDHTTFTYFAARYGMRQVGTVVPGYSTMAQPSAQELAALQDLIRGHGVKAVFVGQTANQALAERVAEDTGVELIQLYTGSLTEPGGEAPTYLTYMRANVNAIVEALK